MLLLVIEQRMLIDITDSQCQSIRVSIRAPIQLLLVTTSECSRPTRIVLALEVWPDPVSLAGHGKGGIILPCLPRAPCYTRPRAKRPKAHTNKREMETHDGD